jgi:Protein of unknown function (DUF3833)
MLTLFSLLVIAGFVVVPRFVGFRSQRPEQFADLGPAFDLRRNLSGPMLCEGVLYGPTGRVTSRFVAEMEGKWDGNQGVLTERFLYDNGERQDREWRLSVGHAGALRAEADDVVGAGVGRVSGPTVQMIYNFRLPPSAGGHVVAVTDWMYLADNGTIVNRSQFRKFGIKVAELVATMRPVTA